MLPISRCRARLREHLGEIKRRRAQSGALGWKAQFEIDDLDERMISPRGAVAGAVSGKVAGTSRRAMCGIASLYGSAEASDPYVHTT
jgi:hypothetical protein